MWAMMKPGAGFSPYLCTDHPNKVQTTSCLNKLTNENQPDQDNL